jgi:site-specific recombinase XerD
MDPLQDFLFAKQLQGLAETTLWAYEYTVRRMLTDIGKEVTEVTTADIRQHLVCLQVNEVTRGIRIKNLRVCYRWLVADGYRKDDSMAGILTPCVPEKFPSMLDDGEVLKLCKLQSRT